MSHAPPSSSSPSNGTIFTPIPLNFPTKAARHPFTARLRNAVFNAHHDSVFLAIHHSQSSLVYYNKQVIQTQVGTDRQRKANVSCTAEVPVTVLLGFQVWKMTTLQGTPQLSQVINSLSLCTRQSNSARFNCAYTLGPLGCKFQQSQEAEDQDSQLCPYSRVREQRIISCHCSFSF